MRDRCNAHWLVDAIASHLQAGKEFKAACEKDERFRDMSIWILRKTGDSTAELIAVADTDAASMRRPAVRQEIEHTDFPFDIEGQYKCYACWTMIDDKPCYYIIDPKEY